MRLHPAGAFYGGFMNQLGYVTIKMGVIVNERLRMLTLARFDGVTQKEGGELLREFFARNTHIHPKECRAEWTYVNRLNIE